MLSFTTKAPNEEKITIIALQCLRQSIECRGHATYALQSIEMHNGLIKKRIEPTASNIIPWISTLNQKELCTVIPPADYSHHRHLRHSVLENPVALKLHYAATVVSTVLYFLGGAQPTSYTPPTQALAA